MLEYAFLGAAAAVLIFIFSRFHPARSAKITENFYVVNCMFVNFYAYRSGSEIALFDTGINPALARRGLKKLGLLPQDVTRVFLTHTDTDHCGGLSAFQNAEVFLSDAEEQMINGRTVRRGILRNRLSRSYKTLRDGESVWHGGGSVKLILTPGHTPGSSSYLIDGHILVTGDLLCLTRSGEVKPFLWLMNKNHRQDVETVEGMREFVGKAEYVCTAHTGIRKRG